MVFARGEVDESKVTIRKDIKFFRLDDGFEQMTFLE